MNSKERLSVIIVVVVVTVIASLITANITGNVIRVQQNKKCPEVYTKDEVDAKLNSINPSVLDMLNKCEV